MDRWVHFGPIWLPARAKRSSAGPAIGGVTQWQAFCSSHDRRVRAGEPSPWVEAGATIPRLGRSALRRPAGFQAVRWRCVHEGSVAALDASDLRRGDATEAGWRGRSLQDFFGSRRPSAKPEQHAMHLIWDSLLCFICVSAVFFFHAITSSSEAPGVEAGSERLGDEGMIAPADLVNPADLQAS